jgi:hypothetical protein
MASWYLLLGTVAYHSLGIGVWRLQSLSSHACEELSHHHMELGELGVGPPFHKVALPLLEDIRLGVMRGAGNLFELTSPVAGGALSGFRTEIRRDGLMWRDPPKRHGIIG